MSEKRTLLSRPRTRVYDCNYNIGEKYYKPMVEQLDRKYSGRNSASLFSPLSLSSVGSRIRDDDDFLITRRGPPPFANELETSTEQLRRSNGEARSLEDDLEEEIANSVRKLKVIRASKASPVEDESTSYDDVLNEQSKHKRINFTNKILDSVGVNGKMQDCLEDEIFKKKSTRFTSAFDDEPTSFTKWTVLREPRFDTDEFVTALKQTAACKARQSRARLADIENEMDSFNHRNIVREKRMSNLKSLIAGEDPLLLDNTDSFKLKKASNIMKKVTF